MGAALALGAHGGQQVRLVVVGHRQDGVGPVDAASFRSAASSPSPLSTMVRSSASAARSAQVRLRSITLARTRSVSGLERRRDREAPRCRRR